MQQQADDSLPWSAARQARADAGSDARHSRIAVFMARVMEHLVMGFAAATIAIHPELDLWASAFDTRPHDSEESAER